MKETIADRLKRLRTQSGISQQKAADELGVSRVAVTKWESGQTKDIRHDSLLGLAKLYKVSLEQLLSGLSVDTNTEKYTDDLISARSLLLDKNTLPAPSINGMIPVISWVQAGQFCASPDLFHPGDAEEWLPALRKFGSHTYGLRVQGDSMVSPYPGTKSYPEGSFIFVDPEKQVTNGCRVVVRIHDEESATFKVYAEDAGKRYLKPINPQYPVIEMTEDMMICGVVVGTWQDE